MSSVVASSPLATYLCNHLVHSVAAFFGKAQHLFSAQLQMAGLEPRHKLTEQ